MADIPFTCPFSQPRVFIFFPVHLHSCKTFMSMTIELSILFIYLFHVKPQIYIIILYIFIIFSI